MPTPPIDPSLVDRMAGLADGYLARGVKPRIAAIADIIGLDQNTVRKYLRARGKFYDPEAAPVAPVAPPPEQGRANPRPAAADAVAGRIGGPAPMPEPDPVELARERIERTRRLKEEKALLHDIASERSLRAELERLIRETSELMPPPPPYTPPPVPKGASVETALLLLSDWHAYERVTLDGTQGFNEYNAVKLSSRVPRIIDQTISIKRRMEAGHGWRVPHAVVACNGDFISGSIHDVERHSDAPNVMLAAYGCGELLALAIRDLAAEFERVDVMCTVGNHGRLPDARKVQQKDPTRSWDWLIYAHAEAVLRGVPNVRFVIPNSYVMSYNIGSKRFVQYHGHDIKSWNSVPHYGIDRWTRNTQALRSQALQPADYFLISHFHTESSFQTSGSSTKINGSLIGGTEYTVNSLGKCDAPTQKLMFVNDPVGVCSEWSILAEDPARPHPRTYPVYPWERLCA